MSEKLASEKVVVSAPMSFAGSAQRIWKWTDVDNPVAKVGLAIVAVTAIAFAWCCIAVWYLIFGLLLVPYRLLRRGSRKRKKTALQHREVMAAVAATQPQPPAAPPSSAGWYPDPRGRFGSRYFDGTTWTIHVVSAGQQSEDPAGT